MFICPIIYFSGHYAKNTSCTNKPKENTTHLLYSWNVYQGLYDKELGVYINVI